MPLAPLAALTAIPAFKVLRFETPAVPWTFPRAQLSRILHSLAGCTDTDARLESGRFVLTDAHLAAGGELHAQSVRAYQRQVLDLAKESLERFPREARDALFIRARSSR